MCIKKVQIDQMTPQNKSFNIDKMILLTTSHAFSEIESSSFWQLYNQENHCNWQTKSLQSA